MREGSFSKRDFDRRVNFLKNRKMKLFELILAGITYAKESFDFACSNYSLSF